VCFDDIPSIIAGLSIFIIDCGAKLVKDQIDPMRCKGLEDLNKGGSMKTNSIAGIVSSLTLFLLTGFSHAALTTIGTATYAGQEYNLIWDDDNNGNSIIWLDYTQSENIVSWLEGLEENLTYNIDPAYTVDWGTSTWRLPSTVSGPYIFGFDGTTTGGYNITSSELGHLFYEELGNLGYFSSDGTRYLSGWGLLNTGDFENLLAVQYWSGTAYSDFWNAIWSFNMYLGHQSLLMIIDNTSYRVYNYGYGIALRNAQVSLLETPAPVPVPGTIWLFGFGLIGLVVLPKNFFSKHPYF